ncbi:MAG: type II toxin-antitoxin system RelE/ParE family toxin [Sandaracinaceae bacterium]|nr:type II toxin-antitoxin system RelE/ParE family toxin [Sandaracinaceae bacterium]
MERTLRELDEAFHLLAATPRLGRQCDDIKQGYRRLKVRSHLIYYRLDAAHEVDIVRILHGKMDPTPAPSDRLRGLGEPNGNSPMTSRVRFMPPN